MPSSKIHLLPQELVNKIAAGEVVERPSSVVKELVENAIDAQASEITVEIKKGGRELIRVIDNGHGICASEVPLSVKRHATSKIDNIDDLFALQSYGFRGEALSSIAEVSLFEMQTRNQNDDAASFLRRDDAGWALKNDARSVGTTISISHLFYNIPARRKFLKSDFTEYAHVLNTLIEFSLYHFEKSFKLIHNGKIIFHHTKKSSWIERVSDVLGSEVSSHLLAVAEVNDSMKLHLLCSHPQNTLTDKKQQYIFVNGRPVRDHMIMKAVFSAYQTLIPKERFPAYLVRLEVEPRLLDVNVHPRKTEVKFADGGAVYAFLAASVRKAIVQTAQTSLVAQKSYALKQSSNEIQQSYQSDSSRLTRSIQRPSVAQTKKSLEMYKNIFDVKHFSHITPQENKISYKIFGQVSDKYIVAMKDEKFFFFDQHAASEGVHFARLSLQVKSAKISRQKLLLPMNFELPLNTFHLVRANFDIFMSLGFQVEEFGGNSVIVNEVPAEVSKNDPKELIIGIASDMTNDDEYQKFDTLEEKRLRILRYTACRGAVKFGDTLAIAEQHALLRDVDTLNVLTCAHGRPVFWEVSFQDLNKKFLRC